MKKQVKTLTLSKETLRNLSEGQMFNAKGGTVTCLLSGCGGCGDVKTTDC